VTGQATSAGILVYREAGAGLEFLLAHPGGPFWKNRDAGAWSIPKGELQKGETAWQAAVREFQEETGLALSGAFQPLTPIRQKAGKLVLCWAVEADLDLTDFRSGEFEIEWPPRSGRRATFPEVDQVRYFPADEALRRILPAQSALIIETMRCRQQPEAI
jgi:predicted NUDIX family NTP pyrophosphohydrolase